MNNELKEMIHHSYGIDIYLGLIQSQILKAEKYNLVSQTKSYIYKQNSTLILITNTETRKVQIPRYRICNMSHYNELIYNY